MEEKEAEILLNSKGEAIIGTYTERGGKPKFDAENFKNEHPKLFEQFLVETEPYKVFLPK